METTYDDEKRLAYLSSDQVIHAFHKSTQCRGDVCPVHKPSNHALRGYALFYRPEIGSFFRLVSLDQLIIDIDDYNLNRFGHVTTFNSVICNNCEDQIVSEHRHDFKWCSCGGTAVDGGSDYLRRLGSDWTEASTTVHLSIMQKWYESIVDKEWYEVPLDNTPQDVL